MSAGLQKVNFPVPVGGGMDESAEPFRLAPPLSAVARNVSQERDGSLTKRCGYDIIGMPLIGTHGHVLVSRPSDLVLYTEQSGAVFSGEQWRAHPWGAQLPAHVQLRGVLPLRGFSHTANIAHAGGYTALVVMTVEDTTAEMTGFPEDDLQATCIILDSDWRPVWGPVVVPEIRRLPRVEPVTVGDVPGFVFCGLSGFSFDASITPNYDLYSFRVLTSTLAPTTPINQGSVRNWGNAVASAATKRTLYDTHGSGTTSTAYVAYYTQIGQDIELVLQALDGVSIGTQHTLLVSSSRHSFGVWHDAPSQTVMVYSSESQEIHYMNAALTTGPLATSLGGAVPALDPPIWYAIAPGGRRLSGIAVNLSGSDPATPSTGGLSVMPGQFARPQPGHEREALFFEQRDDAGEARNYLELRGGEYDDGSGFHRPVVAAPLLETRHMRRIQNHFQWLMAGGVGAYLGGEHPQTARTADGRILVPVLARNLTRHPWPRAAPEGVLVNGDATPYNEEQTLAVVEVSTDDVPHGTVDYQGTRLIAAGDLRAWDGAASFCPCIPAPKITSYDDSPTAATDVERSLYSEIHNSLTPADYSHIRWHGLKIVLVYTDRNGVEYRSMPGGAAFRDNLVAGGIAGDVTDPCPRINIHIDTERGGLGAGWPHEIAGGRWDVELYVTAPEKADTGARDDGTTSGTTVGAADVNDIVHEYYLAQRTPLQRDGNGFFIPDFLLAAKRTIPLYTDSGELANARPPAANVIAQAGRYVFMISSESPYELWHSKPVERGRGPEFNPNLIVQLPSESGGGVSLASQGDRLIVLCASGVYEMRVASGPDAFGAGSFEGFVLVSSEAGCVNPRGTVAGPFGVFYIARSGPRLVLGDGQNADIGSRVRGLLDPDAVIGALYHAERKEIHVFQEPSDARDGALVFHIERQGWTSHTHAAAAAVMQNGRIVRVGASGVARRESEAALLDGATTFSGRVVSPWIDFGDVLGFKRARRIALLLRHIAGSIGKIRISLEFDYVAGVVDVFEYDATDFLAFDRLMTFHVRPSRQKCDAVRITVEDAIGSPPVNPNDPPGQVFESLLLRWALVAYEVEVAAKRGTVKLQAGAKR